MRMGWLKWVLGMGAMSLAVIVGLKQLSCQATKPATQILWVWWEAEKPAATNFPPPERNPFAPLNEREAAVLSEGRWIGITGKYAETPFLEYEVTVPQTADYHFFVRKFWKHGPFRWRFDNQPWQEVPHEVSLLDEEELRTFIVAQLNSPRTLQKTNSALCLRGVDGDDATTIVPSQFASRTLDNLSISVNEAGKVGNLG